MDSELFQRRNQILVIFDDRIGAELLHRSVGEAEADRHEGYVRRLGGVGVGDESPTKAARPPSASPGAGSNARAIYVFRYPGSPDFPTIFRDYYGPTMNAFDAAKKIGSDSELQAELEALFQAENRRGVARTEIPATHLKVIVRK